METKTVQLNVKVTPKFKTELDNLSATIKVSQAEIVETAVGEYVRAYFKTIILEEMQQVCTRMEEIGIPVDEIDDTYQYLSNKFSRENLKSIFLPEAVGHELILKFVTDMVDDAKAKGEFESVSTG